MVIKNWSRSFVMTEHSEPKWEKVVRDSVRHSMENRSLIILDLASGFGKYLKRVPRKLTRPVYLPAANVSLMPCGNAEGIKNPSKIQFVCTARHICQEKTTEELNICEAEREKYKNKIEPLKEKIEKQNKLIQEIYTLLGKVSEPEAKKIAEKIYRETSAQIGL